ncbi:alanine racemase [Tetragenococcus osmophilus]|uniref:Alanine racemase n=1 Tax=Tetragenococcus osmophilus TaxID=526944 RepID=A0AA37XMK1_9ENTE|nr:alanine racemase [Tetragenococcus osmophilus]AYW47539.1 alanine racemase [Tetragenococcus osmophilus]GMA53155.1 alanine racemase [Alicyclobacillus contaminans]GMA72870.1 alanine racemase [Tetragenococcus osmophilus]
MTISYHRPTKAVIDLNAIQQNVTQEQQQHPDKKVFAVVKADGYGHGAISVASAALAAGAEGFCTATLDEAIELRCNEFTQPILILGIIAPSDAPLAAVYNLSVPVAEINWLQEAAKYFHDTSLKLHIHIKADTGMGRIGFLDTKEINQAVKWMEQEENFYWEGIFTHFATADQVDVQYFQAQTQCFNDILQALPYKPDYIHTANSATAMWHQDVGNMVRLGVAMYGLNPSGTDLEPPYPLQPALSLVSEIVQTKKLPKGYGIGYGKTYETKEEEWIATIPIGYADGYTRNLQGFNVLINGQSCEVVGRVCMDQIMVRLPKKIDEGTQVTLVGKNGGKEISLQDIAAYEGTNNYEVACLISTRVPREYVGKG